MSTTHDKSFFYRLKSFLKRKPGLYNLVTDILGLNFFWRSELRKFLRSFTLHDKIIDIGSGTRRFTKQIINVDIVPGPLVDVVASAYDLPFTNGSVDGIVSEMLLEHLERPKDFVKEAQRVLKAGGRMYASTVFIYPYHDAPGDYWRWTVSGLRSLMSDFVIEKVGIYYGPAAAFVTIKQSLLATLFSFGSRRLKVLLFLIFWVVLWPLRFLDLVLRYLPTAQDEAAGFYIIVRKA